MSGFTKGPWVVFDSEYGNFVTCSRGYPVHTDSRPNEGGNLHLIAAAPDMYEALKAFIRVTPMTDINRVIIEVAIEAIEKAGGKQLPPHIETKEKDQWHRSK